MNKTITKIYLLTLIFIVAQTIGAQCDYTDIKYDVSSSLNINYGEAIGHDQVPVTLRMNIYKPKNDHNAQRPLIVMVHGGGFYGGKKEDFNAVCQDLASRGYVAATISYRLGFERARPLAYPFIQDKHEMIRAIYRGMQDARGAIRFLKNRSAIDSIDIDNVFIGGGSAGGFIALACAYMDEEYEKPPSANKQSTIQRNDGNVIRPDLGSMWGDLHKGENNASVKGVINIFGGLVNTNVINNNKDKYAFHYHQTEDPIVPCETDRPYHSLPFVPDNYPIVNGSCTILSDYQSINYPMDKYGSMIHNGTEHTVHNVDLFLQEVANFLTVAICGKPTSVYNVKVSDIAVYPNPAYDFAIIQEVDDVRITSMSGKEYFIPKDRINNQLKLHITDLPKGMYIITGRDQEDINWSWRMIKMD